MNGHIMDQQLTIAVLLTLLQPLVQAYEDVESYQKVIPNDKNPQWKEKINTNDAKIVLAVDPKSTEEEIAADRMKILMNLGTEAWTE
jgi:hypothetical protein